MIILFIAIENDARCRFHGSDDGNFFWDNESVRCGKTRGKLYIRHFYNVLSYSIFISVNTNFYLGDVKIFRFFRILNTCLLKRILFSNHVQKKYEKIFDILWDTGVFVGHLFEILRMSEGPFSHDAGHIFSLKFAHTCWKP